MRAARARARLVPTDLRPIFNQRLYDWYRTGMAVNHHAHEQEHPLVPVPYKSLPAPGDGVTGTAWVMQWPGEIVSANSNVGPLETLAQDMTITLYINANDAMDMVISSGTTTQYFMLPRRVHFEQGDVLTYSVSGATGLTGAYMSTLMTNRLG